MGIVNLSSGTRLDEIADSIFRISTTTTHGAFSHNQYLIVDEQPLLFHTGSRRLFDFVKEAVDKVIPFASVSHIAFSHFESDECGALNQMLAAAPAAEPLCGRINMRINADAFDRTPRALANREVLTLGRRRVCWLDAPHVPHGWECGYLFEETTRTLLCGDLFTQGGGGLPPLTTCDILGPSEVFRARCDYFSHTNDARHVLRQLAATEPTTLACMHGSAWQGDGAGLLHALADAFDR